MARIVVRCPFCKATKSVDNRKKSFRCDLCKNKIKINECEVVVPPQVEHEYHGKWFNNHTFLGYFIFFTGIFGIDFFIKKRVRKGIIAILICWTGASMIQAIFRGMEVLALEDDEINDYYKNMK